VSDRQTATTENLSSPASQPNPDHYRLASEFILQPSDPFSLFENLLFSLDCLSALAYVIHCFDPRSVRDNKLTLTMTLSPSSTTSNFVALLGLSKGSILSIDGQSIILKTDDFVGIRDLPMDDWHFVTVRSSAQASITVGLVVSNKTSTVRRYDPHTEELSSIEVDESTCLNLQHQVTNGQLEPHRMIPYNRVVAAEQARLWKEQKSYVSPVLLKLRGLQEGNKIVPGSFEEETPTTQNTDTIVDGTSVIYPSIPVVPIRVGNAHTHTGTKRYLGQLSPADRTSLFFHAHPAGRLVNDVLLRYYQNQWQDLVGDIQLSYLLFLQLQCLGSLENWYVHAHAHAASCAKCWKQCARVSQH
jgi:hypothetical protein